LSVPINRHLVPQFSLGPREPSKEDEGIELTEEDLEFGSYQNEEIDLAGLLGEEIRLALPIRFLCKEDCKGLCPKCGANLNEGPCPCPKYKEGSPFAVLKDFTLKS
jgi:Predicted metal-binding, possibly nucleic acid-binding protein